MERVKLNDSNITEVNAINSSTSSLLKLEDIINAIQFSGKYIKVKGKMYLTDAVKESCDGGSAGGIGVEIGGSTTMVPFYDLVKSIKTYGLQNVTKVGNKNLTTKELQFY